MRLVAAAATSIVLAVLAVAGTASGDAQRAGSLPVSQIEQQLHVTGETADGVLSLEVDRDDLGVHRIHGTPVTASFQINGTLTFQPLTGGRALFNGDFPAD